jgi:hypothetical protein
VKSLEERIQAAFKNTLDVTGDRASITIDLTDKEIANIEKHSMEMTIGDLNIVIGFRGGKIPPCKRKDF